VANLKSLATKFFAPVFYLALIIGAVFYVRNIRWDQVHINELNWSWVALAAVLALLQRYWYAFIWMFLLKRLGATIGHLRLELIAVYAKSWLGRYIPGGVTWILGKIYFATKLGVSATKLGVSSFLEGVLQIISILISAVILLTFDPHVQSIGWWVIPALIFAALIGLLSVYPPIFNRVLAFGYRRVRKAEIDVESLPNLPTIARGLVAFSVTSVLSGLQVFCIAAAIDPHLDLASVFFVVGLSNFFSAASMLAVFAPAGLGVQELMAVFLGLVVSPAAAALTVVLLRLFSIVMDLVFLATAMVARSISGQQNRS
jgi:glycosyltransferase 2 family protein